MYDLMPKDNLIVPVDSLESGLPGKMAIGDAQVGSNYEHDDIQVISVFSAVNKID